MILKSSKLFYRNKNCSVTYYQSLYEVSWGWKNLNNDKFWKIWKKFYPTIAKNRDVQMLKNILLPLETMQQRIIKPFRRLSEPWGWEILNNENICQNFKKYSNFCQKNAKIRDV